MKKLIATAAVALTAITAQPAMAGGDDFVKGVIGVVILNEILNPNNHNRSVDVGVNGRGQVYGHVGANNYPQQPVIINNGGYGHNGHGHYGHRHYHQNCGTVQNVYRMGHGARKVVTTDACSGRIIMEKIIY